jgi:hypothetical protein
VVVVLFRLKFNSNGTCVPFRGTTDGQALAAAVEHAIATRKATQLVFPRRATVNVAPESNPDALLRALLVAPKGATVGP